MTSVALKSVGTAVPTFDELCLLLGAELMKTIETFAARHGLAQLDHTGLGYMSVKLSELPAEVLMFGLNRWPDDLDRRT